MMALAIRTVFWDIGGVLLSNGFGRRQRAGFYEALALGEEDRAEFEARREDANWFWERGLIDDAEFFQRTLLWKPRTFSLRDVQEALYAQQVVAHPGSFEILHALHAKGQVRLATLNNESRLLNEFRLNRFRLRRYFEFCICSAYVGEMKPAAGIYRAAFEIGGDKPGEACFIDDKEENVAAANAAGLIGLHFTTAENLRAQLDSIGVGI
jgi:putative hydrolase of the HAD superfamily